MLAIRNIDAHASTPVRYHLLVDRHVDSYRPLMCVEPEWRDLLGTSRAWLHSLKDTSRKAHELHRALGATATGHGKVYLFKNIMHRLLPAWLGRVIFLDADLFFLTDIAKLWAYWDRFTPGALFGMALEQNQDCHPATPMSPLTSRRLPPSRPPRYDP